MITPNKVKPIGAKPESYERDCTALEKLADAAIERADKDQQWPAQVPYLRENLDNQAIDDTVQKYRVAGWEVTQRGGYYFAIDRPGAGMQRSLRSKP